MCFIVQNEFCLKWLNIKQANGVSFFNKKLSNLHSMDNVAVAPNIFPTDD